MKVEEKRERKLEGEAVTTRHSSGRTADSPLLALGTVLASRGAP